jgi:trans-aconitate methyltransferase
MTPPSKSSPEGDWRQFYRAAAQRPPRELLRSTLARFEAEGSPPGKAVDLGCGPGPETVELLHRGWQVHAIDAEGHGIETLLRAAPAAARPALQTEVARIEDLKRIPVCDLLWAGWSLPYCPPEHWARVWRRVVEAIKPGGRFAGDFFGLDHGWADETGMTCLNEPSVRALFGALQIESCIREEGTRCVGGETVRWQAFSVVARKPG